MTPTNDRKADGLIIAVGMVVFIIGVASGSAYFMLGTAIAALAAIALFWRRARNWSAVLLATSAAAIAITVAAAVSRF